MIQITVIDCFGNSTLHSGTCDLDTSMSLAKDMLDAEPNAIAAEVTEYTYVTYGEHGAEYEPIDNVVLYS